MNPPTASFFLHPARGGRRRPVSRRGGGRSYPIAAVMIAASIFTAGAAGAAGNGSPETSPEAAETVVVYNVTSRDSRALAEEYVGLRGIPRDNVCGIRCRRSELVTRRQFEEEVFQPVLRFLEKNEFLEFAEREITVRDTPAEDDADGKPASERTLTIRTATSSRVRYLVPVYGVPVRIRHDPEWEDRVPRGRLPDPLNRNNASVDAELALLPSPDAPRLGPQPNPYYDLATPFTAPFNTTILLVVRLDGPSPDAVRRMMNAAVRGEAIGLRGRACVDLRGLSKSSGHRMGDDWLRGAAARLRAAGFALDLDEDAPVLDEHDPATDLAFYLGWYTKDVAGPFAREDFRFRSGAVAYHLHSNSASSLRQGERFWTGPLVDRGAAASLGSVWEPYLHLTPNLQIFTDRILDGYNLAESAYQSIPALSWQIIVVGDPLYRPCGRTLDAQIATARSDAPDEARWLVSRKARLLARLRRADEAVDLCVAEMDGRDDPVLLETLAEIHAAVGDDGVEPAAADWARAAAAEPRPWAWIGLQQRRATWLESVDRPAEALRVLDETAGRYEDHIDPVRSLRWRARLAAAAGLEERAGALTDAADRLESAATDEAR